MADNIEKNAANSMANSDKYGGFTKMRNLTNILTGKNNNSRSSSNTSGGGTGTGTGNGWTAEDYKNYNDYEAKAERRKNNSADREVYRQGVDREHVTNMQTVRNNQDLLTDIQRKRADAALAHRATVRAAGYGNGAQGTSQQQTATPKARTTRAKKA